jgi:hypothetical protein
VTAPTLAASTPGEKGHHHKKLMRHQNPSGGEKSEHSDKGETIKAARSEVVIKAVGDKAPVTKAAAAEGVAVANRTPTARNSRFVLVVSLSCETAFRSGVPMEGPRGARRFNSPSQRRSREWLSVLAEALLRQVIISETRAHCKHKSRAPGSVALAPSELERHAPEPSLVTAI